MRRLLWVGQGLGDIVLEWPALGHDGFAAGRHGYRRLQRWAHMLGYGGHCFTKSRRYSVTFALLRDARIVFRRNETNGPEDAIATTEPTTLVVNFLQFVGAGWRTPADAMLANASAAMAREHAETAVEYLRTQAA
jgi:hypothetical protein